VPRSGRADQRQVDGCEPGRPASRVAPGLSPRATT
jgi:hypothetical protein